MRGYVGGTPFQRVRKGVFTINEHREWIVPWAIGVQDTGTRGVNGAGLRHVILSGAWVEEVTLSTAFFDAHPSYQFPDWTDASDNVFCKIPRAWWWRGNMPDTSDGTTPRWTMLLSPVPRYGFASNPGAFKRSGAWLNQYYYGKYRGYDAGSSKVGSKAGQTPWASVSFDNYRTYCANNGAGYHMQSLFEWHEILARAVIERKTFQLVPEADRATPSLCVYRGINDFAYGPTTGVCVEWMDGIRTDASGNYEVWGEAGGSYNTTVIAPQVYSVESEPTSYGQSILSGGMFDSLFMAAALGPDTTCMIPDLNGGKPVTNNTSRVCYSGFYAVQGHRGAFHAGFHTLSSSSGSTIGSRLAKW